MIEGNDARAALATLRERLAGNQLVSITVAETGRRTLAATFLGGRLRLATGPVHLARTSGAPLLPIVAVRKEDGAYTVSIEPPLDVRDSDHPPYSAAIRAYAAMLEGFVRRYPTSGTAGLRSAGWRRMFRISSAASTAPATCVATSSGRVSGRCRRRLHRGSLALRSPRAELLSGFGD